jgi:hypothetical protein
MKPARTITRSQEPSTGFYLEPDESGPYHRILFLKDPSQCFPPSYVLVFLVVSLFLTFWLSDQHPIYDLLPPFHAIYFIYYLLYLMTYIFFLFWERDDVGAENHQNLRRCADTKRAYTSTRSDLNCDVSRCIPCAAHRVLHGSFCHPVLCSCTDTSHNSTHERMPLGLYAAWEYGLITNGLISVSCIKSD